MKALYRIESNGALHSLVEVTLNVTIATRSSRADLISYAGRMGLQLEEVA